MDLIVDGIGLANCSPISVLVGRNGVGKSRLLRQLDSKLAASAAYNVRYLSPERGGTFERSGGIEDAMRSNQGWTRSARSKNQGDSFKQVSAAYLMQLETAFLRRMETADVPPIERSFDRVCLDKINGLLLNVQLQRPTKGLDQPYVFVAPDTGEPVLNGDISSGEAEVVSLAAEILHFVETADPARMNVLLLDEPDVHLHPDMQAGLARLMTSEVTRRKDLLDRVVFCLATHSTPLICALASTPVVSLGMMEKGVARIDCRAISADLRKVAPYFGHPLSLAISNDPLLIVEGEDDQRVWQRVSRSAKPLRLFICIAESVAYQAALERLSHQILTAVYDKPCGYSIRDGDGVTEGITPEGCITRFRLQCYAIENLLLTEESLAYQKMTWQGFRESVKSYVEGRKKDDPQVPALTNLIENADRNRHLKIKDIRDVIAGLSGKQLVWEEIVGRAIARAVNRDSDPENQHSVASYLGPDLFKFLCEQR